MSQQIRLFDGLTVESFRARFGTVDIEDEDAEDFRAEAELVLVIKVSVDGESTKRLPNGEWQRTNSLSVASMRVATGAMRNQLIEYYGLTDQLVLPVDVSSLVSAHQGPRGDSSSLSTDVDRDTGEIRSSGPLPGVRDPALASFLSEVEEA